MGHKYKLSSLLVTTLLTACSQNPNTKGEGKTISMLAAQQITYNISVKPIGYETPLDFSSVVDTFFFVALESVENALISRHGIVELINDRIYVLDHHPMAPRAFCFSNEGRYLFEIIKVGKGPKEMVMPYSMHFDPINQELLFCDRSKKSIHFIDLDGNYLREKKIGSWINAVHRYGEDGFVFLCDGREDGNLLTTGNSFKSFTSLNICLDRFSIVHSGGSIPFSSSANHSVNFIQGMYDTVVNINERDISKRYVIDFGSYKLPDRILKKTHRQQFAALVDTNNDYAGSITQFSETDDHIVFSFLYSPLGMGGLTALVARSSFEIRYFNRIELAGYIFNRNGWFQKSGDWYIGKIMNQPEGSLNDNEISAQQLSAPEANLRNAIQLRELTDNPIYVFYKLRPDYLNSSDHEN